MRPRRLRADLVELLLPAIFVATLACVIGLQHYRTAHTAVHGEVDETLPFAEKYGPTRFSEGIEEWLIRDFFRDRRAGIFVDVGAGHYQQKSNTFYLEHSLGWRGIAVDPVVELEADYVAYRPSTKFRPFFVSDVSDSQAKLYFLDMHKSNVSSGTKSFTEQFGKTSTRTVPTITLTDLLDRENISKIDFLSMDIELGEPKALAGFDLPKFQPALVCIEAHPEVRQQILDYFSTRQYVVVGAYLRADPTNLYFKPR